MNDQHRVTNLSDRQREILRLVARHMQAKEVARLLNISESTVKTHTEEARRRLGVSTTREAARLLVSVETALPHDDGRPPLPMAAPHTAPHGDDHEQTISSEQRVHDYFVEGSGTGLDRDGRSGKAPRNQSASVSIENTEPDLWSGKSGIYDGGRNVLVTGRLRLLRQWLRSLNFIQWFLLVAGLSIVSALIVGGLLISIIGVMEGFQQINNRTG